MQICVLKKKIERRKSNKAAGIPKPSILTSCALARGNAYEMFTRDFSFFFSKFRNLAWVEKYRMSTEQVLEESRKQELEGRGAGMCRCT